MTNGRSDEVDSLRAIAMLAVLALHAHLLPPGWIGVWLFFVISGYVVTLSMLRQEDGKPLARLGDFLKRRAARILPVYYFYIGLGLATALALGFSQDGASIASLFLFFNNGAMIVGEGRINGWPTGHLWTLSTEMQFYALYGVALCFLPRRHVRMSLIALLILCPLARLIVGHYFAAEGWRPLDAAYAVYAGPALHFDIFAMGALLAFAHVEKPGEARSRPLILAGLGAVTLYFLVYAAINLVVRQESGLGVLRNILSGILIGNYREVPLYSVVGLLMTGLVAFAAEGARGPASALLRLPVLQWIGRISYGAYLFHPLALKAAMMLLMLAGFAKRGGALVHVLQFGIALPFTLLLAWISAHMLEGPMRRWIQGDSNKGGRVDGAVAAGLSTT